MFVHRYAVAAVLAAAALPLLAPSASASAGAQPDGKPECGSPASLQAGNPYTGTVTSHNPDRVVGELRQVEYQPEDKNHYPPTPISLGRITGAAYIDGKKNGDIKVRWTAHRGYVVKPFGPYEVTDLSRESKHGEYVCDPETGAVRSFRAGLVEAGWSERKRPEEGVCIQTSSAMCRGSAYHVNADLVVAVTATVEMTSQAGS